MIVPDMMMTTKMAMMIKMAMMMTMTIKIAMMMTMAKGVQSGAHPPTAQCVLCTVLLPLDRAS